jgi:hypothetical protein
MAERRTSINSRGISSPSSRVARSKKSRTPISCDRCKSRKTKASLEGKSHLLAEGDAFPRGIWTAILLTGQKCVDPVPGPCNYCARIGAPCGIPNRRKQRPFYHVTEEEYRCGMQILQHLLPSKDLSSETLRDIAKNLEDGGTIEETTIPTTHKELGLNQDDGVAAADLDLEEVEDLHDQLGCLMEDSLGEYRKSYFRWKKLFANSCGAGYVGAYAEIVFNAAVCSLKGVPSPESIIEPSKFSFPPRASTSPNATPDASIHDLPYLPPRDCCNYYVSRFFEEVHCIYWLYPAEQFYARLDETYAGCVTPSRPWLCSLYSICALGAVGGNKWTNFAFAELVSSGARNPGKSCKIALKFRSNECCRSTCPEENV